MKIMKRLCSALLAVILVSAMVLSIDQAKVSADDSTTFVVTPNGASYKGTNYATNTARIDVSSGTVVQIGYYSLKAGWQVFGIVEWTGAEENGNITYKATLQGNYRVTVDADSRVIYFQKTYVEPESHTHNLMWVNMATKTYNRPAVDTLMCPTCYHVESVRPAQVDTKKVGAQISNTTTTSAMEDAFKNVKAGDTVKINLGKDCSVSAADMNIIKASNANVILVYVYNNKTYTVTIPAGKCVTNDSIKYYGPELMRAVYNGTVQ